MDDFVVQVRQISQYPRLPATGVNDVLLVQSGGLGGAYASVTIDGLLAGLGRFNTGLSIGLVRPEGSRGFLATSLTTPSGSNQGFNWYRDNQGMQRYLQAGPAGLWQFANGTLSFSVANPEIQLAHEVIRHPIDLRQLLAISVGGQITMAPGAQIKVGRDPLAHDEVTTLDWIRRNTVTSLNGRTGEVKLTPADLNVRTPEDPGLEDDRIATTAWVQNAISFRLTDLLVGYPFVQSFNNRKGNVWLNLDDIHRVFFRRGNKPKVPTPPLWDNSLRIANTRWVEERIEWIELKQGPQGPTGPQGPPGTGFNVRGVVPDEPSLPATGNEIGDLFIAQDTNTGFVWDGAAWQAIGIIAPSARVYVSDTPPVVASNGDLWWNSLIGELSVWYDGPSGGQWVVANTGLEGPPGPPGPLGPPGPSVGTGVTPPFGAQDGWLWYDPVNKTTFVRLGTQWLPLSEAPPPGATVTVSDTPPLTPIDGDLWWNSVSGELMVWYEGPSGNQWVIANAGVTGPPGPPGLTGPPGPPGNQGVQGPPGTGLTFLGSVTTETALPTTGNSVGDMWVTDDTQEMFTWDGTAWHLIGVGGGVPEAPTDGRLFGRQNAGWVELIDDGTW